MFACLHTRKAGDTNGNSLSEFAFGFSPIVELTRPDVVVMDVEGCELLFGSAYGLANEIGTRATKTKSEGGLEIKLSVAIAANPDAAIHAATFLEGITFISPGEELTCFGDFAISRLDYSLVGLETKLAEEIFETLRLWGVHTFREFASLPVVGIAERLGPEGVKLHQLAAGKTERHLKVIQPAPVFSRSLELEHALSELEPLSFVFARLLNQICASLNSYAFATNEVLVQLALEDQTTHERRLSLPYAMRDHKVFLKLLLLDIELHPPQSAVTAVTISCEPVKPRLLQNGLFTPLAPEPEKLELTLARLAKLVGEKNVGAPELLDTHRPDAFTTKRFVLKSTEKKYRARRTPKRTDVSKRRTILGFRMFRPPLKAVVELNQGWPSEISAWGKQRSVYGKVISLAGPWRTTGGWWLTDRWARDEWDVALKRAGQQRERNHTQTLYRIYRDLISGDWFVEGSYD